MVSIIIPTLNRLAEWQRGALMHSLAIQTDKDFEVVVVDDGSTDGTIEYLKAFPIRLFHVTKPDRPASRASGWADNVLIREAKGDIILHTDDDTCLSSNAVAFAKENYKEDTVWWGATINIDDNGNEIARDNRYGLLSWYGARRMPLHPVLNAAHGALWIAPKELLWKIGGHAIADCDKRGQDSILGMRLAHNAINMFTSEIECYHFGLSRVKRILKDAEAQTDPVMKEAMIKFAESETVIPTGKEPAIANGGRNFFENSWYKQFYEEIPTAQ